MKKSPASLFWGLLCVALFGAANANAAFLVEVHESGLANENFEGDGGNSSSASAAPGVTATNSLFAVNTTGPWTITYTPGTDADNVTFTEGDDLGNNPASGLEGGATGWYAVYATTPWSQNVGTATGSLLNVSMGSEGCDVDVLGVNQNVGTGGPNMHSAWWRIGVVYLEQGTTYEIVFTSTGSEFVSFRLHGVLFEKIPDPVLGTDLELMLGCSSLFEDVSDPGTVTRSFAVTNNSDAEITIDTVAVEGENAAAYTVVSSPTSITAGGEGTVEIEFSTGSALGAFDARAVILSGGDTPESLTVDLSAEITSPFDLIGHYPMNEEAGDTLTDVSGNDRDGVYGTVGDGSFTLGQPPLAEGTAVDFGGTAGVGFGRLPSTLGIPPLDSFSVSLWIEPDTVESALQGIFSKSSGEPSKPFSLALTNQELIFYVDQQAQVVNAGMAADTTYHVVLVYEDANGEDATATSISLYVDGTLADSVVADEATAPTGFVDPVADILIGAIENDGTPTLAFNGTIDDVQLYGRALTAENVTELFNNPGVNLAGTFATEPEPFFATATALTAEGFILSWNSEADATYTIEYKDNLRDADWTALDTVTGTPDGDGNQTYTDTTVDADAEMRFYRVTKE